VPVFKNRVAFKLARGLAAFFFLDAGLIRGEAPETPEALERRLDLAHARIERQEQALEQARERAVRMERELNPSGMDPAKLVWVFGTVRTGSTWLARMLADLKKEHALWNEPRVGELFGTFFYERAAHRRENENFIMSLRLKPAWMRSMRMMVLGAVGERHPGFSKESFLIVKEPSGSIGAPLLMDAFPESRMVLLVRDPRDVVASALDAAREGSWAYELRGNRKLTESGGGGRLPDAFVGKSPEEIVEDQSRMYLEYVGNSRRAYESHDGPKALVRYEELLSDAAGTMRRLCSALEIPVEEEEVRRVVEEHSWENIPEGEKGSGKFARRGESGSWREDLTPEQARKVEEITGPLLREFYPD
jgi:hypothetical protein